MRCAGGNDPSRIQARRSLRNLLRQAIGKNILGDGYRNGAAEGVEENGDGVACGHVLLGEHDLDRDKGDLDAGAGASAGQDLIPDPPTRRGVDLQGVQEAGADDVNGAARVEEGDVGADGGDGAADDDASDGV